MTRLLFYIYFITCVCFFIELTWWVDRFNTFQIRQANTAQQISILSSQVTQLEPILTRCVSGAEGFFPLGPDKRLHRCSITETSLTYDQVGLKADGSLL